MTVYETELPGVGKKFEVELDDDRRLVVVIHNTGKRELFLRPDADADAERLFELSDRLARQVGTIMEGAYFQPVRTDAIQTALSDDALINWVAVPEDSPLVGETLADAELRSRTGATAIAIQRGDRTLANPDPDIAVEAGDVLVVLGSRSACQTLEGVVAGGAAGEFDLDAGERDGEGRDDEGSDRGGPADGGAPGGRE